MNKSVLTTKFLFLLLLIPLILIFSVLLLTKRTYEVTFFDSDGTVLATKTVEENQIPTFSEIPKKASDSQYDYIFKSWDRPLEAVKGNTAYTANYEVVPKKEEESDEEITYVSPIIENVEGEETLYTDTAEYTVQFIDEDGSFLQTLSVKSGEVPMYTNPAPAPKVKGEYLYIFKGWDKDYLPVTDSQVYKAVYNKIKLTNSKASTLKTEDTNTYYYTVKATVSPNLTYGIVQGGGTYAENTVVQLEAKPNSGYEFIGWNDGDTNPVKKITVTADSTLVAKFAYKEDTRPKYTINASSSNYSFGSVTGGATYHEGDAVTLTAIPRRGYKFIQWNDGDTNPVKKFVVNSSNSSSDYIATFGDAQSYTISVIPNISEYGFCTGSGTYYDGDTITISASPYTNYRFSHWEDDPENKGSKRTITVSENKTYKAVFVYNGFPEKNDIITLVDETLGHRNYLVLSSDIDTGYATLLSRDSLLKTQASGKNGYGDVYKTYKDSKLDLLCDQFYKELSTKTQNAIIDTDVHSYIYIGDENSIIDNRFNQFYYPGVLKEEKDSTGTLVSTYTRKVLVPDLSDIEKYFGSTDKMAGSYTFSDLKKFFNTDDSKAYHDFAVRSLVGTLDNDNVSVTEKGIVYFSDNENNNGFVSTTSDIGGNVKTVRPMFTINLFDENIRYVNDNSTIEYDSVIPQTHSVSIVSQENGSIENVINGNINHGTLLVPKAVPDSSYLFFRWSDGIKNDVRYLPVVDDINISALFTHKLYHFTGESENEKYGKVVLSSDTAIENGQITLTAVPTPGFRFVKWDDGNTEAVRTITGINDDTPTNYIASFEKMEIPNKGTIIYINGESDNHKEYLVVDTDSENATLTLISRDSIIATQNEASSCGDYQNAYQNSTLDNLCSDFYDELSESTKKAIVETTIDMNSYYYSDSETVYDVGAHSNNYTYPGIKVDSSKAKVFVPDLKDLELCFSADDTNAGAYSEANLVSFFNASGSNKYVVRSLHTTNLNDLSPDRTKVIYFDSATKKFVNAASSDAATYSIRPMFVVSMVSDGFSFNEGSSILTNPSPINKSVIISASYGGQVSLSIGHYHIGSLLYVTATPSDDEYSFARWSDDDSQISASRYIVVDNDIELEAKFIRDFKVTVSVDSNCTNMGQVSVSNDGHVKTGESITISAEPNPNYRFVKWKDGSTDKVREIIDFNEDTPKNYIAVFAPLKTPSKGDIISIDGESDNHKEYLVLDVDINNNNMLVVSRDSDIKTENVASSCGDYQYAYSGSKLDLLCAKFYNDLKESTKNAVNETTIDLNKYLFKDSLNLDGTYSSKFAYPGKQVDEIKKTTSEAIDSSLANAFVLDLKDIESFYNASDISAGAFSKDDLKKFFNISSDNTGNYILRSLLSTDIADSFEVRGASYVIYDSSNSVITSADQSAVAQYYVRPAMNMKINSQGFTYDVKSPITTNASLKKYNVKFISKGDGSISGTNGEYNYGSLVHSQVNSDSTDNFIKWFDGSTKNSIYAIIDDNCFEIKALFKENNLEKVIKGDIVVFPDEKENHKKFVVLSVETNNDTEIAVLLCIDSSLEMQLNNYIYDNSNIDNYLNNDYYNDFSDELKDCIVVSETTIPRYAVDTANPDTFRYPLVPSSIAEYGQAKCFIPSLSQLNLLDNVTSQSFRKLFGENTTIITSSKTDNNQNYYYFFSNGKFVNKQYDTKAKIYPAFAVELSKLSYYKKVGKYKNAVTKGDFITINNLGESYNDYVVLKSDGEKATVMLVDKLTSKAIPSNTDVVQYISDECDDFYQKISIIKNEILNSTKTVYQYTKEAADGKEDFLSGNVFNVQNNVEATLNNTSNGPVHSVGLLDLEELFGGDLENAAEIRKSYLNALFTLGDNDIILTRDFEKADDSSKSIVINKNGYNTYSNTNVRICPVFDINLESTNYTITVNDNVLSNIKTVKCNNVFDENGLACTKTFHYYKNEAHTIPTQVRPGYTFGSWSPNLPNKITQNMSINANWTKKTNVGVVNYNGLYNNKSVEITVGSPIIPIQVDPIEVNKDKENKDDLTYKIVENEEYEILNNIKSTGAQYIDLGISSSEVKDIDIQFSMNDVTSDQILFGTYTNAIGGSNYVQIFNNTIKIHGNSGDHLFDHTLVANKMYRIETPVTSVGNANLYDENGELLATVEIAKENKETGKMALFDLYYNNAFSGTHYSKMNLYSFKAYNANDELILDLIPVKRVRDNKLGLYNKADEKFFINGKAGTDFEVGEETYPSSESFNAYEKLESITSTGAQYIDTLIKDYSNLKATVSGNFTETTGTSLMGVKESVDGENKQYYFGIDGGKYVAGLGKANVASSTAASTSYYTFSLNSSTNNYFVDSTYPLNSVNPDDFPSLSFTLFGVHTSGSSVSCCKATIKNAIFTRVTSGETTGTPVMILIPVKRLSDGAIGMYDTISKVFYGNKGTGSFIATPTETPEYIQEYIPSSNSFSNYYEELEYIESHGTEYINTGITATNPTVDIKFQMVDTNHFGITKFLFAKQYIQSNNYSIAFTDNETIRVGETSGNIDYHLNSGIGTDVHSLTYKSGELVLDGVTVCQPASSLTNEYPITLFGRIGDGSENDYRSTVKVYDCKIYENNVDGSSPILLLDLIPVRRLNDGVIGMYDKLTGDFFENLGEGYFGGHSKDNQEYIKKVVHQDNYYKVKTYELLDYIQSTQSGSTRQYIDTGITGNGFDKLEIECKINESSQSAAIFGAVNDNANRLYLETYSNKYNLCHKTSATLGNYDSNKHNVVINNNGKAYFDGVDKGNVGALTFNQSIVLFARNTNGSIGYHSKGNIYLFKAWKNDKLVRDLVPAKRLSDNVIGMYDKVNKEFYENKGTGSFVGQSKEIPEYIEETVQRVDYIESTDKTNFYINTGYAPNQNTRIFYDFEVTDWGGSANTHIYGALFGRRTENHANDSWVVCRNDANNSIRNEMGNENYGYSPTFDLNTRHTISSEYNKITFDSTEVSVGGSGKTFTNLELFFFAVNTNGNPYDEWNSMLHKLYGAKIFDNGNLVRNFVPVKYNNEYCLLDLVENKLYLNKGTGKFTGGYVPDTNDKTITTSKSTEYKRLEYIQSTGTQHIELNYNASSNTRVTIEGKDLVYSKERWLSAARAGKASKTFEPFVITDSNNTNQMFRATYGSNSGTKIANVFTSSNIQNCDFLIDMNKNIDYVKFGSNSKLLVFNATSFNTGSKLVIFAGTTANIVQKKSSFKLKSYKLYDNGLLIRDLVPVERSDGKPGLLDLLTDTFYVNKGTGEFIKGESIKEGYLDFDTWSPKLPTTMPSPDEISTTALWSTYLKVDNDNGMGGDSKLKIYFGLVKNDDSTYSLEYNDLDKPKNLPTKLHKRFIGYGVETSDGEIKEVIDRNGNVISKDNNYLHNELYSMDDFVLPTLKAIWEDEEVSQKYSVTCKVKGKDANNQPIDKEVVYWFKVGEPINIPNPSTVSLSNYPRIVNVNGVNYKVLKYLDNKGVDKFGSIIPVNSKSKVVLKGSEIKNDGNKFAILGSSIENKLYGLWINEKNYGERCGTYSQTYSQYFDPIDYPSDFEIDYNGSGINGHIKTTKKTLTMPFGEQNFDTINVPLFGETNGTTVENVSSYLFKDITVSDENNELKMHLVPIEVSGKAQLLDLVSNTIYAGANYYPSSYDYVNVAELVFDKWNNTIPATMPESNITLTAEYKESYDEYTSKKVVAWFDTDGGNWIPTQILNPGDSITKPADPVKENYIFIKWDPEIQDTIGDTDIHYKAIWKENIFELKLKGIPEDKVIKFHAGEVHYLENPTSLVSYTSTTPVTISTLKEVNCKRVGYIQGSGSQFINTGIKGADFDKLEIEFKYNASELSAAVFGVGQNLANSERLYLETYSNTFNLCHTASASFGTYNTDRHKVEINNSGKAYFDGVDKGNVGKLTFTQPLFLFARNFNGGAQYYSKSTIYSFKVWKNGEVVKNLVPVKCGSEYCFLDLVEKKLYHNAGTGSLSGPEPSADASSTNAFDEVRYTVLDYLQGDGTKIIDTKIVPNNNSRIELDYQFSNIDSEAQVGCGEANDTKRVILLAKKDESFTYGLGVVYHSAYTSDINRHTYVFDIKNKAGYLDGVTLVTSTNDITTTSSFYLFGRNMGAGTNPTYIHSAKFYGLKYYENDVLVKELIPAKDSSGNKGLLDILSGEFISADTEIIAGNDVKDRRLYFDGWSSILPKTLPNQSIDLTARWSTNLAINNTGGENGLFNAKIYFELKKNADSTYSLEYKGISPITSLPTADCMVFKGYYVDDPSTGTLKKVINADGSVVENNFLNKTYSLNNLNLPTLKALWDKQYEILNHIESNGNQYIDTGYKTSNTTSTSRVVIEFANTDTTQNDKSLFGAYSGGNIRGGYIYTFNTNGYYRFAIGGGDGLAYQPTSNDRIKFDVLRDYNNKKISLSVNGGDPSSYTNASTKKININEFLFGGNNNGSPKWLMKYKLYSCMIYDNSVLVRDFIPVRRISDGALGVYDKVNKEFYENKGTGVFTGQGYDILSSNFAKLPSAKTETITYNGNEQELFVAGTSNYPDKTTIKYGLGTSNTVAPTTWTTNLPKGTNAGTYYLWAKIDSNDDNISLLGAKYICSKEIAKATPSFTTSPSTITGTKTYNGNEQELFAAGTSNYPDKTTIKYGLGTSKTVAPTTWTTNLPKCTNAGTYYLWAKIENSDDNLNSLDGKFICSKVIAKASADFATAPIPIDGAVVFNNTEHELFVAGISNFPDKTTIKYGLGTSDKVGPTTWTTNLPKGTDIGTYYLWAKIESNDGNVSSKDGVYICSKSIVLEGPSKFDENPSAKTETLTYNGNEQELFVAGTTNFPEYTTIKYGLGTSDKVGPTTWTTDLPKGTNAGTYYLWAKIESSVDKIVPLAEQFICSKEIAKASVPFTVSDDMVSPTLIYGTDLSTSVTSAVTNNVQGTIKYSIKTDPTPGAFSITNDGTLSYDVSKLDKMTNVYVLKLIASVDGTDNYDSTSKEFDYKVSIFVSNFAKGDFITINGEDGEHNDYMVLALKGTKALLLSKDHIHMDYLNKNTGSMTGDEISSQLNTFKQGLSTKLQGLISSEDYNTYTYTDYNKSSATANTPANKELDTISYYELQDFLGIDNDSLSNTNSIFNISNSQTITTRDKKGDLNITIPTNIVDNKYTHVDPVFWVDLSASNIKNAYVDQLPDEYQKRQYVEGRGAAFVDTGIRGGSSTRIIFEFSSTNVKQDILGVRTNKNVKQVILMLDGTSKLCYKYNNVDNKYQTVDPSKQIITADLNANIGIIYGQNGKILAQYTHSGNNFNTDYSLHFPGYNNRGTHSSCADVKVYSLKIYNPKDTLQRDYVPCVRKSDNVAGFYDRVSKQFFPSQSNTAAFIAGPLEKVTEEDTKDLFTYEITGNYFTNKETTHAITFKDGESVLDTKVLKVGESIIVPDNPTKEGLVFDGWDIDIPDFMPDKDIEAKAKWKLDLVKGDFISINGEERKHNDYMVFDVKGTKALLLSKDHIHMDYLNKNTESMTGDEISSQLNTFKQGLSTKLQGLISSEDYNTYTYTDYNKSSATANTPANKELDTISYYELQDFLGIDNDSLSNTNSIFNISNSQTITTRDKKGDLNITIPTNIVDNKSTHVDPVFWVDLSASKIKQTNADKLLPSSYQRIEYVKAESDAHIDTGVYGGNNTKVEMEFSAPNVEQFLFGARSDTIVLEYSVIRAGDANIHARHNKNSTSTNNADKVFNNQKTKVVRDNNVTRFSRNGTEIASISNPASSFTTQYPIYVPGCNTAGTSGSTTASIYSLKMYNPVSTLVRDYVPCVRKADGVVGLYDLVNKKFCPSDGTKAFTKPAEDDSNLFSYDKNGNYFENIETKHTVTFKVDGTTFETKELKVGERIASTTNPTKEALAFDGWDYYSDFMPDEDLTVNAIWKEIDLPSKGSIIKLNDGKEYRVLSLDGTKVKVMAMYDDTSLSYNTSSNDFVDGEKHTTGAFKYQDSDLDKYLNETWYNSLNNSNVTKPMYNAIQKVDLDQRLYSSVTQKNVPDLSDGEIYSLKYRNTGDGYAHYSYLGLSHVGERFVYTLDLKDIYDYFQTNSLLYSEVCEFFGCSSDLNDYHIALSCSFTNGFGVFWVYEYSFIRGLFTDSNNDSVNIRPTFVIDLAAEGVVYKVEYNPVKGDLISISGEDEKYNDYVVLDVDGNNVKLALRDEMPSFLPKDVGISDVKDRDQIMNYIDNECAEFKGNLSQSLQSSMVETDYYSIRIKSCGIWAIGATDDSQKKQYKNKFVCTLSIQDVNDYMGTNSPSDDLKAKYVSTFFLTDESSDIVGRDNLNEHNEITRSSLTASLGASNKVRLCPVFTIDLTKLSSNIFLKGNALND